MEPPKEDAPHIRTKIWSVGLICLLFSVFLLPNKEVFFPLSRYAMFANQRPQLEPLPFLEIERENGTRARVDIRLWSPGGVSNGRNLIQSLLGKRRKDMHKTCLMLAKKIAPHFETPSKAVRLNIMGGQFDLADVLKQETIQPVNAKKIYSCPISFSQPEESVVDVLEHRVGSIHIANSTCWHPPNQLTAEMCS